MTSKRKNWAVRSRIRALVQAGMVDFQCMARAILEKKYQGYVNIYIRPEVSPPILALNKAIVQRELSFLFLFEPRIRFPCRRKLSYTNALWTFCSE